MKVPFTFMAHKATNVHNAQDNYVHICAESGLESPPFESPHLDFPPEKKVV